MSTAHQPSDPLFATLDSLVRDGTLTGPQAKTIYTRAGERSEQTQVQPLPQAEADQRADTSGRFDLQRLLGALGIYGSAVILAGFLLIALLSNERDFEWKTFLPQLAVTLGFAAAAAASWLLVERRRSAVVVTGVLAATAVLTLALTATSSWDHSALAYVAGTLMLVGGLAGYWFLRRDPLTGVAVLGGLVLLAALLSDTVDSGGDHAFLLVGAFFAVFGLAVVAAGWFFSCRNTTGLIGSAIAALSMPLVILPAIFLGALGASLTGVGRERASGVDQFRGDVRTALILGLVICLVVAALYAVTRHPGYLVIAFLTAATLPLAATLFLARDHPLRWAMVYVAVGGLVVAGALILQLLSSRGGQSAAPSYAPVDGEPYGQAPYTAPTPDSSPPLPPPPANQPYGAGPPG